jgi:aspartyl-tRNA(Asn)/glutamyl-tRNA(Gln) amidotransferase subunit C
MKVTEEDVVYVADLANLALTGEETGRMIKDLNSILDYIGTLNELDTANVTPMVEVASKFASGGQAGSHRFDFALRKDVAVKGLSHEVALRGAAETDGVSFKVPKVIEK